MKSKQITDWFGDYCIALHHFLQHPPPSIPTGAQDLGQRALELDMDTLIMAKLHDRALVHLLASETAGENRSQLTDKASLFFREAISPIERTHPAAKETQAELDELHASLDQRTADLAESNRALKEQTAARLSVVQAMNQKTQESNRLLTDSRLLEEQLQAMARKILSANESERKSMSLRLNDELAQTLLGINMRMLALKKAITTNQETLNEEIAMIQLLVEASVELIKHLAHEFSVKPS